jgi:uncharacterized protein (DUF736 family)
MASTIATLTKTSTGFKGVLTTLMLKAPIEFQANVRKANDKAPDFRVVASNNGFELGAAWIKQARSTGEEHRRGIHLRQPLGSRAQRGDVRQPRSSPRRQGGRVRPDLEPEELKPPPRHHHTAPP